MKYTLLILIFALFVSCSKDSERNFVAENDIEITNYLTKNGLIAEKSESGLYYIIEDAGNGKQPNVESYVNVSYKGYMTDNTTFNESDAEGIFINLQQVILGWTEGISHFKEGGSGKLLIPSHLAYGKKDYNGISGGSVLIFDIKLIEVFEDAEACFKVKNEKEIKKYITDNELDAQKTESGLYYMIEEEGTGAQPTASSNVTVAYKGYFINGSGFDQSKEDGISFSLSKVIKGWTEGIPYFKEGGKGKLLIPSHLAYGPEYYNGIPGGSVLIFDVELIKVN